MSIAPTPKVVDYPSGDGQPMAETWLHVRAIMLLHQALEDFFRGRDDVFIASDMFWYWEEGNPAARISPDVMAVPGVQPRDPRERRSFFSWEEAGATPAVVFEMASKGTWKDDLEDKFDRYEQLGVHEYFLFDPEAEYLVPVLQGYRLHGSAYRRIREADGELTCELGFRLRAEDTILRLIDGRTNQPILTRAEAADAARKLADAAEQEAVRAKQQADVARQHADRALRQMDAERQRADALATELAALRQRLSGGGAVMAWRHGQKPVIGLVGGIGAGKSTAGRIFAARGGFLIDADVLGHEALEQDVARLFILERWGSRANLLRPDGRIDRRALGRVVFENSADRRALEEAVFPYIRERAFSAIAAAQVDPAVRFVVLDAAVMLEAGWGRVCDKVIYIDAPRSVRLARVAIRSGWSDDDLTSREAAQWSADRKKAVADAVVVNDDGPEKIGQQLDELLETWGVPAG